MIYYELDLYHSGILGQKHGVRRFQYPDGSLTPLGRLRYRKNKTGNNREIRNEKKTTVEKKNEKEAINNKESEKEYKTAKSMSDDELNKAINRMRLENTYNDLVKDRVPPDKHARAKKIASDLGEKAVREISGKAIEAIANNIAKKINSNNSEPEITNYKFKDITKVSDKDLNKALKRKQAENQYITAMNFMNDEKKKK